MPCLLTLGPARLVVDGWQGGVQSSVSCWGPVHVGLPRQLSRRGGGPILATWRSRQAAILADLAVQLAGLHAWRPPDLAGCAAPRPSWKPLALQVSTDVGVGITADLCGLVLMQPRYFSVLLTATYGLGLLWGL